MIALGRPRGACMIPPERRCAPLPPGGESLGAALRLSCRFGIGHFVPINMKRM